MRASLMSGPEWSGSGRTLTFASTTRFTATNIFIAFLNKIGMRPGPELAAWASFINRSAGGTFCGGDEYEGGEKLRLRAIRNYNGGNPLKIAAVM